MTPSFILDFIFVMALGILSTAFLLISMQNTILSAARWLGVAFALGAVSALLQIFVIGTHSWHLGQVFYGFFAVSASVAAISGLMTYFKVSINGRLFSGFLLVVLAANWYVQALDNHIVTDRIAAHLPNVFVHMFAAYVIMKYGQRKSLEWIMSISAVITALFFLANPLYSIFLPDVGAENQLEQMVNFDGVWNAFGIVLGLSNGLLIILMFVRDMFARSRIDRMSGLLNRKTFEDEMDLQLENHTSRTVGSCLIVADLDHFKRVNDTYGHARGDEVIERFARILRQCSVDDVIAGRLGGEEFGVFLPNCPLASAFLFAEAVCGAFRLESFEVEGPSLKLTASFGVAQLETDETAASLFARADAALYRAKLAGRDRVYAAPETVPSTGPQIKVRQGNNLRSLNMD